MAKRSSNTKSKIVKAAWDLFYKQGYENTTVDEIVEESGTSKGSFYHYFVSKDALLGSLSYLFDEKYEELEGHLDPEEPVLRTLVYLNQELFGMIDNTVDEHLISMLYATQMSGSGEKSLLDNSRLYYRLLKKLMIRGQENGELTADMTVNELVRYYAMCERSLICEWCLCDWNFSLKTFGGQMLPLMLEGIRAKE